MDFLQGTLDMLVLRTLAAGPLHGYGIAQAIRHSTEQAIAPEAGSLYPALQRLELQGLLAAKWEAGKDSPPVSYDAEGSFMECRRCARRIAIIEAPAHAEEPFFVAVRQTCRHCAADA